MSLLSATTNLRNRGRDALVRRLGIDARALAAFRVSLAVVLLADLLLRSRHLVAFYTDAGVLPRAVLRERFPAFAALSLHAVSGSAWVQVVLFLVASGAALCLLVGYRTTLAALISWVLLVSLHARNPLVLNAGDSLLRRLLFWGLFLPLGTRWSVDSLRSEFTDRGGGLGDHEGGPAKRVTNAASAALLVQVVVVYTVNAAFKLRGDRWLRGEATEYVLSLGQFTVLLGDVLAEYPGLLSVFDRLWLGLLVSSVLLVGLTGRARTAFVTLFAGMHLGMALTLQLGVFPFVCLAGLIPFLPAGFWNAAVARWSVADRLPEVGWFDRLDRLRPEVGDSDPPTAVTRWTDRLASPVVAVLLAAVLVWNAATLGVVALPAGGDSAVDPAEHRWDMFAPEPRDTDGWYVVPGELASGNRTDAFRESSVRWGRPPDVSRTYPSVRWLKYLVDLQRTGDDALVREFAEFLCWRWDASHDTDLVRVGVYYVEQPTRLDGPEPTNREALLQYACGG